MKKKISNNLIIVAVLATVVGISGFFVYTNSLNDEGTFAFVKGSEIRKISDVNKYVKDFKSFSGMINGVEVEGIRKTDSYNLKIAKGTNTIPTINSILKDEDVKERIIINTSQKIYNDLLKLVINADYFEDLLSNNIDEDVFATALNELDKASPKIVSCTKGCQYIEISIPIKK